MVHDGNVTDWKDGLKNLAGKESDLKPYFGQFAYIYSILAVVSETTSEVVYT